MARNFLVGVLACLALSLVTPVHAYDDQSEFTLDIPRQPLADALQEFSEQTKLFHGYLPDTPEEEKIPVGPLKGRYTVRAALTKLLEPAGLAYSWTDSRNISIDRPGPAPPKARVPANQTNLKRATRGAGQSEQGSDQAQSGVIYEVVTTAFSPRSVGAELSAPVLILEREDIERTGAVTIFDILKFVSQQPYLRPEGFLTTGAQYAELRGLGTDTTLVLINGRRAFASAASFAANAFDLNTVPLSAIERVEVLLDSASALYGADAIGGIINIVLRDDIAHPSADVYYGATQGGGEQRRASVSAGYRNDRVNAAWVLDYLDTRDLLGVERNLWRDQDYRRFGSVDQRSINSSPGNITLLTGLATDPATWLAVPEGTDGKILTPADLLAGQRNRESLLNFIPIVPQTRRASAVGSAQVDLTSDLRAAAELLVVDRRVEFSFGPPLVPGLPVLQTNPFNILHMPVAVNTLLEGVEQQQDTNSTLVRGAASLHGNLSSWEWELTALRSEENATQRTYNLLDFTRVIAALSNPDPSKALNVFQSGRAGSAELLSSLVLAPRVDRFANDASQATAFFSGPLFELPAGDATALVGAEWRSDAVQFDAKLGSFDRKVAAAFTELHIPVFGADTQLPALRELSLAIAGRFDDYSDFGSIFNPQYGLIWRPYRDLAVRGAFGRSFRPPSVFELFFPRLSLTTPAADPQRNREVAVITLVTGGNPDLQASRGKSVTAGLEFAPQGLKPLKLSATYWSVAMDDRVTAPTPTLLLANEGYFADRVVRAEPNAADLAAGLPGRLLQLDVSRLNFGRLETSGVDLGAAYELDTAIGQFSADLTATWVDEFKTVDLPAMPAVDRVNVASAQGTVAKWRAVAMIGWRDGALDTTAHLRYVPAYDDTLGGVRNGRGIPSQTFVDAQIALDLGELADGDTLFGGVKLVAGASNLFDQQPHFAEVSGLAGYDMSQGDLKGRFWYLRLGKAF